MDSLKPFHTSFQKNIFDVPQMVVAAESVRWGVQPRSWLSYELCYQQPPLPMSKALSMFHLSMKYSAVDSMGGA